MNHDAPRKSVTTMTMRAISHPTGSRVLENVGFLVALVLGASYVVKVEIIAIGTRPSFPWGLVIICGLLIAPKTLGKATSGRIWSAIARRVA